MAGDCTEEKCCEVPVCLSFVCASATEEFKEQVKEIFSEILEDLCGCDGADCCPDTPVVDGKIDMCLQGHTINVAVSACKGILQAGGTCGACEIPDP